MKKGWQTKKLREVCELVNGRAYSKSELLAAGKYRVLRVGNFFTNDHWYYSDMELEEKKYCDTGDLLYAWSASFGPRMWTGGKVIYHYHIWKVVHDSTQIDQKFLCYFFQWDTEKIKEDQGTGTTMMHVSMGSMNERDIDLPPLAEQQRIVGLLDEAFEGLATAKANAEKNLQNARALFESHLQSVFAQRGPGWVEKSLVDVCTFINGRAYKKEEMLSVGKYPLLRVGNFFTNRDWYYSDLELDADKYCDNGDLLYAWSASFGPRVWDGGKVIYHYHIWKVLPHATVVEKRFLLHLLEWDVDEIKKAHGTGTTMMHVSKGSMESRVAPIPPLKAQVAIASMLDDLREETQRLARLYERKQAALEALKKSLLHQAFTGEL